MNKRVLVIIIGIILLIVAALTYVYLKPAGEVIDNKNVSTSGVSSSETVTAQTADSNKEPGVYVDYSEETALATKGTKLLFFHAPWCPQCREMEASIQQRGIPSGVTVFKVDYDSNQSLRQQYGVTLQTTFVRIDDDGNKIASYVAYEEPRFSSVERELLR